MRRLLSIAGLSAALACSAPAEPESTSPPASKASVNPPDRPASSQALQPPPEPVAPPEIVAPGTAPAPPPGEVPASYPAAPPKTIKAALGEKASPFPLGFEEISMSWRAEDLIRERPWVVNEGRIAPQLSYIYREAAYDAGTGRGDNPWLIANSVFGAVEYHFQRDAQGSPVGPLHKIIFLFELGLPKEAVQQIRAAGDAKWGEHKTELDPFQISFDRWAGPEGLDVLFHYSPGGSIAESLELLSETVPALKN
jgi:hypothetical protein